MRAPVALAVAALAAGCALTAKGEPLELRYFSPEAAAPTSQTTSGREGAPRMRLGRVSASANLRTRIVFRTGAHELGEYDDRRWSDDPEAYTRRALVRALFASGRARAAASSAPTLDVHLVAFEEVRRPHGAAGAVELTYALVDGGDIAVQGHTRVEREATATTPEAVVAAIGSALDAACAEVASAVVR